MKKLLLLLFCTTVVQPADQQPINAPTLISVKWYANQADYMAGNVLGTVRVPIVNGTTAREVQRYLMNATETPGRLGLSDDFVFRLDLNMARMALLYYQSPTLTVLDNKFYFVSTTQAQPARSRGVQ